MSKNLATSVLSNLPSWILLIAASCADMGHSLSQTELLVTKPLRVMPLGDSITAGTNTVTAGGYRIGLKAVFGDRILFVGQRTEGHSLLLRGNVEHAGLNGDTIESIRMRALEGHPQGLYAAQVREHSPDVVLLIAGNNNLADKGIPWQAAAQLTAKTARDIARLGPVVFLSPIPIPNYSPYDEIARQYNEELFQQTQLRPDSKVVWVNATSGLIYPEDFSDVTHPNLRGHCKIANRWANALSKLTDI